MLFYKGYEGTENYSAEDKVYYGNVVLERDLVSYESACMDGLKKSFEEAVDDYIETRNKLKIGGCE